MAKRLYFLAKSSYQGLILEKSIEFEYFRGQNIQQKRKSIESMHHAIMAAESGGRILEVSTKSSSTLGQALSAFHLTYTDAAGTAHPVFNIFQSSKVFEGGGPYRDILALTPVEAKRDERIQSSGRLLGFNFEEQPFGLVPRSYFFDWIYLQAMVQHPEFHEELLTYDIFTDIEYNMNTMFACQARAAAYFVALKRQGILEDVLADPEKFQAIYTLTF